jgi:hypothetical protein
MPDSDLLTASNLEKLRQLVKTIRSGSNSRFKFQKRSQFFIRTYNETLSVVAMCVCNEDCSPVGINR